MKNEDNNNNKQKNKNIKNNMTTEDARSVVYLVANCRMSVTILEVVALTHWAKHRWTALVSCLWNFVCDSAVHRIRYSH